MGADTVHTCIHLSLTSLERMKPLHGCRHCAYMYTFVIKSKSRRLTSLRGEGEATGWVQTLWLHTCGQRYSAR